MASITNSVSKKYTRLGLEEDEAPQHDNSEAERIIQELVKKQTNTCTSLAEQLSLEKEFTGSSELLDVSSWVHGECSLQKFSQTTSNVALVNHMKSRGLSDSDVQLALDIRSHGEQYVRAKYRLSESSALSQRLRYVQSTLAEETTKPHTHVKLHTEEILKCVPAQSQSSRLLQFAQQNQSSQSSSNTYPADHPINKLQVIEQELFAHLTKKCRKRKRRGTHQTSSSLTPESQHLNVVSAPSAPVSSAVSQWDSRQAPHYACITKTDVEKTYTCSQQTWYTVEDKQAKFLGCKKPRAEVAVTQKQGSLHGKAFVAPQPGSNLISLDEIKNQRLSLEEITQDPKFSNYQRGTPSKTLYVKNLGAGVTSEDLVALFVHFEDPEPKQPRLVYRLMSGKMRGQAFITFSNAEMAEKALEVVNGYKLRGRPMIIQFGRK